MALEFHKTSLAINADKRLLQTLFITNNQYIMITFSHPEPKHRHLRTWPEFLPFQGCPSRCIYCSQHLQTGQGTTSLQASFDHLARSLEQRAKEKRPAIGLGFFGGTFTGIPQVWMSRFLALAKIFKDQGVLSHIRCSTRPDAVTPDMLASLAAQGLDMVELGIQSFDPDILDLANRKYDQKTALNACTMITYAGLELGLQMLPGLPGHTEGTWERDMELCCQKHPAVIQLYPCLVLRGTVLAAWLKSGRYTPQNLEDTVTMLARSLPVLWAHNIAVIRIGLTPEPQLLDNVLAGPWHPSLGNIVRSRALLKILTHQIGLLGHAPASLTIPTRYTGELWGYKGENIPFLAKLGITKNTTIISPEDTFILH
ncbi:MAG: radical SAM protein [Desulfoplanes sp.]|nr:radical SAM protein [Desulfoplanes sp.]